MCMQCLQAINDFRHNPAASPWNLSRTLVADRLLELVEAPDGIQQGAIGLCGQAAFLRAWLLQDHLAVVRFAIALYDTGRSQIGAWVVQAAPELMDCDHSALNWNGRTPCPAAEWMMMGAIQDQQNTFRPKFSGQPVDDWTVGLVSGDVAGMLGVTGRYTSVDNGTALIPHNWFDGNGWDDAMRLAPDDLTDVILLVNAAMLPLGSPDGGFWAFFNDNISNHYITLCEPLVRVDVDGVPSVRMTYVTWGDRRTDTLPCALFDGNYYGAIVAHAGQARVALPLTTPAVPALPSGLEAGLEDGRVVLHWQGGSTGDTEYRVERWRARTGGWTDTFWQAAARPSTDRVRWSDDGLDATADDTVWYRVCAVNAHGIGPWTAPVMVTLPAGTSRRADPQTDLDIRRPPCFVSRVAVLRAPAGLQPTGFGRFAAPACDCQAPQWVYDARLEPDGPQRRRRVVAVDRPLRPDREAYVFVRFDDYDGGAATMDDDSVSLRVTGRLADGRVLALPVALQAGGDGRFHWGRFEPPRDTHGCTLTLELHGSDAAARYTPRVPAGHEIDGQPLTRARPMLDQPPLFPFTDYEPGPDTSHHLTVAAIPATLAPDAHEPDDTHAAAVARPVALAPAVLLEGLTLHDATDADRFAISYPAVQADDDCRYTQPVSEVLSRCLGLSLRHEPPRVDIAVYTDDPLCVDLALYRSDGVQRLHDLPATSSFTLYHPTHSGCTDHRFELVLKNAQPAQQGPFGYRLFLQYRSAFDSWAVDTGAPAYRPRGTVNRQVLAELVERLDLPRPGDELRTRATFDTRAQLQRLSALMRDTAFLHALKSALPAHSATAISDDQRRIAAAAGALGLHAEAEGLLQLASAKAGMAHDPVRQIDALHELQAVYAAEGKLKEAQAVAAHAQALAAH